MKINIESTTKIVKLNGIPARVWEGETESGVRVHCYITRIAIDKDETRAGEFERELKEQKTPSPEIQALPLSLIL